LNLLELENADQVEIFITEKAIVYAENDSVSFIILSKEQGSATPMGLQRA
jgi:hypothetical protein